MALDYRKCAEEIFSYLGGRENLVSAAHCATRLRLVTVDNSKIDMKALENVEGVKGVFSSNGQLQPPPPRNSPCSSGPSNAWETSLCPSFRRLWPAVS